MGSRAFTALARNVWHVMVDEDQGRRLFLSGKSNLALPASGLAFVSEGVTLPGLSEPAPVARWQAEPVLMTADEWLEQRRGEVKPGPKTEKVKEAEEFLTMLFNDRGVVPAADAIAEAAKLGISEPTLKRARRKLNSACWREGDPPHARWYWCADQTATIDAVIRSAETRRRKP